MHSSDAVFLPIIGQILIGVFFVFLAMSHGTHWRQRVDGLRERQVILPTLLLWISIVLYFLGGLFLIFGVFIPTVVAVLVVVLLIRALLLGNFWSKKGDEQHAAVLHFMTNLALIGALLRML